MYLRFVITTIDDDSHQPQGLFVAAHTLLESGDLNPEDHKVLQDVIVWFNKNLPTPGKSWDRARAIFWFREGAHECIRRMWTLVSILQTHGKQMEVQKCAFLANVVYYDAFQVAAYPHKRDGKRTFK